MLALIVHISPDGSGEFRLLDENGRTAWTVEHPNMVKAMQNLEQFVAEGLSYEKFRWFRDRMSYEI